ncbi:hypothetical protein HD806DRAFT_177989 [Xylariaceae sp. AK1471]|nr:hypothetical protein HD806DRAFT_177989 [Xylariaceae sp. AK1471]
MASRKAKDSKAAENELQYASAIPIQVWRSDGTEMPSEYDQYERVEDGAKTIIEWQNKLGQALAAELMPESTGLYFLQDFPSHYHLRWYQASSDKKKHQAKHYYLFGYPEDPGAKKARKYYRSPNHFLPHLLWLVGDSQDRGDCACEFCSGSKPITSKAAKAKPASSAAQAPSPAPASAPPSTSTNNTTANTVASTPRNATAASNAKPRPVSRPSTTTQPTFSHEAQTPASHQAPGGTSSVAQRPYVAHDHGALFRAGEVVWYKNNNSYRVGMIVTANPTLSIIPFGHPLYRTQALTKEEADVRPFLAFSIPQINSALQELRGRSLAQIDWQALQERFGTHSDPTRQEGLAIEATKLAATRVDQCYSTFNAIQESVQDYDTFGGIFLGAEKICVGEAVRIKLPREPQEQALDKGMPVVMLVRRILVSKEGQTLLFEGSLWKLQHATLAQQSQTLNQAQLPSTMLGEKEFRDGILQSRGWRVEWVLINQNLSVGEPAIRGRFYETRRLTPILNPAKFQEMLRLQHVDDIQTLLNNRGDSTGPYVGRVLNRAQAVAGAIPAGMPASLGPDVMEA